MVLETKTMVSGHKMFKHVYDSKLSFLKNCLEADGITVIEGCQPKKDYDFSFLVHSPEVLLPNTLLEKFSRAGLKTSVLNLSSISNDSLKKEVKTNKTYIIRLKY